MILNEEQLRFFYNEVLGEFEYSEEDEADGVDPLGYVLTGIRKMRKEINRLSGVSVSRWQSNAAQQGVQRTCANSSDGEHHYFSNGNQNPNCLYCGTSR